MTAWISWDVEWFALRHIETFNDFLAIVRLTKMEGKIAAVPGDVNANKAIRWESLDFKLLAEEIDHFDHGCL